MSMNDKPRDIFDAIRRTVGHVRQLGLGIDGLHIHPDDNPEGHETIWGQPVILDSTVKRGYVFVKVSGVMAADWVNNGQLIT